MLWCWLTRREFGRTKRLRRAIAAERKRLQATIDDLESRLRRQEADSLWERERLEGRLAIATEEHQQLLDVIQRDRQRIAAETAAFARRESEAKFGAAGTGSGSPPYFPSE